MGVFVAALLLAVPSAAVSVSGSGRGGSGDEPGHTETDGTTTTETTTTTTTTTTPIPAPTPADQDLQAARQARCAGGGRVDIALRARKGWIEIRSTIRSVPQKSSWRIIVSHERWIVWIGRKSATSTGQVALRVRNKDYDGPDTIMVRANGPKGEVCRVVATVTPTD